MFMFTSRLAMRLPSCVRFCWPLQGMLPVHISSKAVQFAIYLCVAFVNFHKILLELGQVLFSSAHNARHRHGLPNEIIDDSLRASHLALHSVHSRFCQAGRPSGHGGASLDLGKLRLPSGVYAFWLGQEPNPSLIIPVGSPPIL